MDMPTACRLAAGETQIRLHKLKVAEECLSEYRAPGDPITDAEARRLMELMDAGYDEAEAADRVQAESYRA